LELRPACRRLRHGLHRLHTDKNKTTQTSAARQALAVRAEGTPRSTDRHCELPTRATPASDTPYYGN